MNVKSSLDRPTPVQANPAPQNEPVFDLQSPEFYLNRELTWLAFNKRVLHEGQDNRNPLLEKVFFLAVVGSNLDEFFMKRIGGLKQQVGASVRRLSVDGRLPQEQIDACHVVVHEILAEQLLLERELQKELARQSIDILKYQQLSPGGP